MSIEVAGADVVDGEADERFAGLVDAFRANLENGQELGGSLCVLVDGPAAGAGWGGWGDAPSPVSGSAP